MHIVVFSILYVRNISTQTLIEYARMKQTRQGTRTEETIYGDFTKLQRNTFVRHTLTIKHITNNIWSQKISYAKKSKNDSPFHA